MLEVADAALMIGDPAFDAPGRRSGPPEIDLGEAWKAMTGLPFVFAAGSRARASSRRLWSELLHAARRDGRTR